MSLGTFFSDQSIQRADILVAHLSASPPSVGSPSSSPSATWTDRKRPSTSFPRVTFGPRAGPSSPRRTDLSSTCSRAGSLRIAVDVENKRKKEVRALLEESSREKGRVEIIIRTLPLLLQGRRIVALMSCFFSTYALYIGMKPLGIVIKCAHPRRWTSAII